MEAKRVELLLESKRLMDELDMITLDVRLFTKRRQIADAQLSLAQDGVLGIGYSERKIEEDTPATIGQ